MFEHYSVMLSECISNLAIKKDGIYVDATLGGAGHASKILESLNGTGFLYGFDKDLEALEVSKERLSKINSNFKVIHSDFSKMKEKLNELGVKEVDGILFDLGVSSYQFDSQERGFSYRFDSRLDMRMDQTQQLDAYQVVNTYSKESLTKIFFLYGEEKFAKQISAKICEARKIKPIETTFELVEIIKQAIPKSRLSDKGHPAKQVFQAIRIEVNNELNSVTQAVTNAIHLLKSKGRVAVITFHSLEDRIVKNIFKEACLTNDNVKGLASLSTQVQEYRLVNNKVIVSTEQELLENNRSHSAKLRVIEKL